MFQSGDRPVPLLELFTSQGCSSCPPADRWVAGLVEDPALWKGVVPVVFHVDYWDHLGWKDPFGEARYSERQVRYRRDGRVGSVYTPGIVVHGREWTGWRRGRGMPEPTGKAGVLKVRWGDGTLKADYAGATRPLDLYVAVLGFGLQTDVPRGENAGKWLAGDFVVLQLKRATSPDNRWSMPVPRGAFSGADRYALAAWVCLPGQAAPIQATGGWW